MTATTTATTTAHSKKPLSVNMVAQPGLRSEPYSLESIPRRDYMSKSVQDHEGKPTETAEQS